MGPGSSTQWIILWLRSWRRSYVKCKEFGIYSCMLGKNLHLNEWRVCRRTPKSYVVEYNRTIVICGHGYVAYKYRCMMPKYKNKMRRIFPFRRKTDSRELLRKLSERTYFILSCANSIQTTNGDFYLDFSQINREWIGYMLPTGEAPVSGRGAICTARTKTMPARLKNHLPIPCIAHCALVIYFGGYNFVQRCYYIFRFQYQRLI